jgi:hypothetical protein
MLAGEAQQRSQGIVQIVAARDGGGSGREKVPLGPALEWSFARHGSSLRVGLEVVPIVRPRLSISDGSADRNAAFGIVRAPQ